MGNCIDSLRGPHSDDVSKRGALSIFCKMGNCIESLGGPHDHDVNKQELGEPCPTAAEAFASSHLNRYSKVYPVPDLSSTLPPDQGKGTKVWSSGGCPYDGMRTRLRPISAPLLQKMMNNGSNVSSPRKRSVRIVLTKKQLEGMLENAKELESTGIAVQFAESFWENERSQRWCPSLPTIPE